MIGTVAVPSYKELLWPTLRAVRWPEHVNDSKTLSRELGAFVQWSLDCCSFSLVARCAQELKVLDRRAAAERERNDVVVLQIERRATIDTHVAVALPDLALHFSRNPRSHTRAYSSCAVVDINRRRRCNPRLSASLTVLLECLFAFSLRAHMIGG